MAFPIYLHDLKPAVDGRDSRARQAAHHDDVDVSEKRPSIWKREISFGRRKQQSESEATVGSDAPFDERELENESPVVEPQPEKERRSIWKREVSFGRKRGQEDDPELDTAPSSEEHAEDSHVEQPEFEPEPEREPEPEPWSAPSQWPVVDEPAPLPAAETPAPEPDPEPVFEAEGPVDHEPAPSNARPSIWKRDLSFGRQRSDWEFEDSAEPETDTATADAEHPAEPVEAWPAPLGEQVEEPELTPSAASFAPDPEPEPAVEVTFDEEPLPFETTTDSMQAAEDEEETTSKRQRKKKPANRAEKRAARGSKGGKKLVGLKVGASQISAAVVQSNGSHQVLKLARTSLDRGVVVAGEVRDPDGLAAALRVFFNDNKLPKRDVRLGIASNRVGVRVLDVTGVEDPNLLGNAVRFRAQEVLPIPLSEAVLDYRVLRERTEEDGTVTYEVLVAFAYRELVDRYASVCRLAGLRLVGIDLDGFALLRALVDPNLADGRLGGAAVVTVALGHDRAIMSVSDGAVCEFTRVIEWGGGSLDIAVARVLALTPSQAEPIKRQLTLDRRTPAPEGLSADQAGRARAAMVQEVHAFAREFVSSLQFYQAQPRSLDIGEIVVTGGTAHMPGLVEQLHELIGVSVRIGDPLARVSLGKNVDSDEQVGSLALAIGLGIED